MNLTGTIEPRSAGVWMLDAEGRTEYVNAAMAGMLGAEPADLQGLPLVTFVPDGAQHRVTTYLDRCRRDATAQIDLPLRTKDGSVIWALASTDLLPASPGGNGGFLSLMVDITERKQIEEALRRSESNYRVLAETAQDHIFVIARGDRVEYVNRAAALQLKTVPERVIGRLRSEIFPPDVAERQGYGLQRVLPSGRTARNSISQSRPPSKAHATVSRKRGASSGWIRDMKVSRPSCRLPSGRPRNSCRRGREPLSPRRGT